MPTDQEKDAIRAAIPPGMTVEHFEVSTPQEKEQFSTVEAEARALLGPDDGPDYDGLADDMGSHAAEGVRNLLAQAMAKGYSLGWAHGNAFEKRGGALGQVRARIRELRPDLVKAVERCAETGLIRVDHWPASHRWREFDVATLVECLDHTPVGLMACEANTALDAILDRMRHLLGTEKALASEPKR